MKSWAIRRAHRHIVRDLEDIARFCRDRGAATLIQDVEPLVAAWGTSHPYLRERLDYASRLMASTAPSLKTVVFCTNSGRVVTPAIVGVRYRARAKKPWSVRWAKELPTPVVVAGDTVLTDGLLAVRLRATFLQVPVETSPLWPTIQRAAGDMLAGLLFQRSAGRA